jgi:putative PIN family toxin of toxin-antitoxin system
MPFYRAVIDTSVFIAALRSRSGASNLLLRSALLMRVDIAVSVSLVLEYEAVGKEQSAEMGISPVEIDTLIDAICRVALPARVSYRYRPVLRDPNDEMVLEAAIASGSTHIVTFNLRHFKPATRFGVTATWPGYFLNLIGEKDE